MRNYKYGLEIEYFSDLYKWDEKICNIPNYKSIIYKSNSSDYLKKIYDIIHKNIIETFDKLQLTYYEFYNLLDQQIFKSSSYITKIRKLFDIKEDRENLYDMDDIEHIISQTKIYEYNSIIYNNLINELNFSFLERIFKYSKKYGIITKTVLTDIIMPKVEHDIYLDIHKLWIEQYNSDIFSNEIEEYPKYMQIFIKDIAEENDDILKIIVKKVLLYVIDIFYKNPYTITFLINFLNNTENIIPNFLHFGFMVGKIIELKE